MISIIIPCRNEDLLGWTVANIRASQLPGEVAEIIVIDDGGAPNTVPEYVHQQATVLTCPQRGNCPSRDAGIEMATHDLCLVLDAHMTMPPAGWITQALQWHRPGVIACTTINGIPHPKLGDMGRPESAKSQYYGAKLTPWHAGRMGDYRCWQGQWETEQGHKDALAAGLIAPVGCIMGGAYFLSKRHYLEVLNRPWAELRGWGSSEPVISITHRRLGYSLECWPMWFGHVFRASAPYVVQMAYLYHNQLVAAALAGQGNMAAKLAQANPGHAPVIAAGQRLYNERAKAWCDGMSARWVCQLVEAGL